MGIAKQCSECLPLQVKRVRASLDINLLDAVEGRLIEQLVSDPILLCDVIFVLCQQEAEARGVTDEQFGQAMAGDAIDVMAKAMTTANTDLTMLGDAFKFVGPMAKTAGVSLEEITAAIQLLSNAGIQGEMGGTTLRGMLLSLTSPSSEAKRELDRLGVSVVDSAGNYLDGSKTYTQTLPAGIPAKDFWSFVNYDPQTRSLLQTPTTAQPSVSSRSGKVQSNKDGSVTVWFGPKPPNGKESNWVPTVPGKGWFTVLRLYGPLEAWFDKTWRPGEIQLME